MKPCIIYNENTDDVVDAVLINGSILIPVVQKTEEKPKMIEVVYTTKDGHETHFKRLPELVAEDIASRQPQKVIEDTFFYTPYDATWWARTECEGGLVQFEIDGKWGFCKNDTGEIIIDPVWNFAGPFLYGYAMVSIGCDLSLWRKRLRGRAEIDYEGGKWGFINLQGHVVLPLEYDQVNHPELPGFFPVEANNKWGVVNEAQNVIVPFSYDHTCYDKDLKCFMGSTQVKRRGSVSYNWTLYDTKGRLIVENLSHRPEEYCTVEKGRYFILRRHKRYGVMQEGGLVLAKPSLLKREAIALLYDTKD